MAKVAKAEEISLIPDDNALPKPKLHKLIIKNFRTIGEQAVEIDLDEIVILVGANNTGKSSILRAYEIAMSNGSKEGRLTLEDFPNRQIDPDHLPEIEIQTIISENKPGSQWIKHLENGQMLIRERWIWEKPGTDPKRQGFDVEKNDWSDNVPWGAPNVANAYRPKPHRIDAFSSPEVQEAAVTKLVADIIADRIKRIKTTGDGEAKTDYEVLIDKIAEFQKNVFASMSTEVHEIEESISNYLGKVFVDYVIKLDANPESNIEKTYTPFKESPEILMGPRDGYMSSVSVQGSGARRTLMWTALKYLQENADPSGSRPHVLLLDEPEVCLHPNAIRDAREVLYELPKNSNWQVMITTHSPVFIDLSHDNTTIIRVERNARNEVVSTTLYRPEKAKLEDDEKENLKLLNVCDPYLHEFFFGGKVVIVEGDTEYTAFSYVKMRKPLEYDDVHIVRARGKAIIPSLCKILNQFACPYAILHDADSEKTNDGKNNPAWTINSKIMQEAQESPCFDKTSVIACKSNFETALFGEAVLKDKPYNAIQEIKGDEDKFSAVESLLIALVDNTKEPPKNCLRWKSIDDLK